MSCSPRCSSSAAAAIAALALVGATSCAHSARRDGNAPPPKRIALLPPENLSGAGIASAQLVARLAAGLAPAGVEPVYGQAVEDFLRAHRFRYTGGVSTEMAGAAARELGVSAIAVTTLGAYEPGQVPRIALTVRLVSTEEGDPRILWIDGVSMAGDEDPGPLRIRVITDMLALERKAFSRLRRSLAAFLADGSVRGAACPQERRFAPKVSYRSPTYRPARERPRIAVIPFANASGRSGPGELLALEFIRQLVAAGGFEVLEPGYVRELRLQNRIVLEGGVSIATVENLGTAVQVDLLLGGEVGEYADAELGRAAVARFNAVMLDGRDGKLVWSATSYHHGTEGVLLLDVGRVDKVATLACGMVSAAVGRIASAAAH